MVRQLSSHLLGLPLMQLLQGVSNGLMQVTAFDFVQAAVQIALEKLVAKAVSRQALARV